MTDFLALNRAVFESSVSLAEQSLLLALIDHLPDCRPSTTRLMARSKLSRSTLFRALASLEAMGVVSCKAQPGKPSMYSIDVSKLPTRVTVTPLPVSEGDGYPCQADTPPVSHRHPTRVTVTPKGTKEGTKEGTPLPPAPTHAPIGPVELTGLREAGVRPRPRVDYMTPLTPENWSPGEHGLAYARELGLTDTELEERIVWTRNVSTQFRRGRTVDWWDIRFFEAVEKRAKWKLDDLAKAQQRESVNLRDRVVEYRDL